MTLLKAVDSALVVDGDGHVTVRTARFRLTQAQTAVEQRIMIDIEPAIDDSELIRSSHVNRDDDEHTDRK
jgi:hypothetical protein